MPPRVRVNVEAGAASNSPLDRRTVTACVRRAALAVLADHDVRDAEISLTLLDDSAITRMNVEYLGHDGPTDVISFPLHAPGEAPLGDIYIGWDQALRQAATFGVAPAEELMRLAVHGTLHVLGYDHPEGEARFESEMWRRQEAILGRLEVA